MKVLLDAGPFVALERDARRTTADLERLVGTGTGVFRTHGGVVGQVWRNGRRQVALVRFMRGVQILPLDEGLGREAGSLLALTGGSDVVDAALVCVARHDDVIVTSDPGDIAVLADAAGIRVEIVTI